MSLSAIQNVYQRASSFKETAHLKWVCVDYSCFRQPNTRFKLFFVILSLHLTFYIFKTVLVGRSVSMHPWTVLQLKRWISTTTPIQIMFFLLCSQLGNTRKCWNEKHKHIFFPVFVWVFFQDFFYHRYLASFLLVAEGKQFFFISTKIINSEVKTSWATLPRLSDMTQYWMKCCNMQKREKNDSNIC